MILYIIIAVIAGVVTGTVVWHLSSNYKGKLILLEGDNEETYAFLELHVPIEEIKYKKIVRLKIERKNPQI